LSVLSLVVGWFASGWLVGLRAEHTLVHNSVCTCDGLLSVAAFMMVIELYGSSEFKQRGKRERERASQGAATPQLFSLLF
jgi:hypothetical protein